MRTPRRKTVIWVFLLLGILLGVAVASTVNFAPGDAVEVSDGVSLESPSGLNVTLTGHTNVSLETPFPQSDQVELLTESGNVTFTASSTADATIHESEITGPWTNVTSITAGSTWIEINPEDKQQVDVRGGTNELSFTSMAVDDGAVDFYYSGPNGGTATVKIYDLPADTELGAFDANTGNLLDGATTDQNGVATFQLPTSSHNVQLQTTDNDPPSLSNPDPADGGTVTTSDPTLSVHVDDPQFSVSESVTVDFYVDGNLVDSTTVSSSQTVSTTATGLSEGEHTWTAEATDSYGQTDSTSQTFTVDHYDPQISNLSPVGLLDSNPSNIEADISDADFASGNDGDSLDVTLELDGSQIDSQTMGSNQSLAVSIPQSGLTGGQHTYTWTVTDQYGQTQSVTDTYSVPDTLYVRNELDHSQILSQNLNFNVTFFGEDNIYTRDTSNGQLQLTNLPVNQDFIAVVRPSNENWTQRSLYVQNIYEQQSIYLLNTSAVDTIQSRFILNDPTGEYDAQSVLQIQRPINISGSTQWQTVHADRFGVEGVQATLEHNQRYRIKVISTDGSQQVVGPYRAEQSETVEVVPGSPTIDLQGFEEGYSYNAAYLNETTIEYRYSDPQNLTSQVTVVIHERGNPSNLLQPNSTYFDLGNFTGQATLTQNQTEKRWVVDFVINRDGDEFEQTVILGEKASLIPNLSREWRIVVSVIFLILSASLFSILNVGVGAVVVAMEGALLWWTGWLSGVATGASVMLAILIAVIYHIYFSSGP